MLHPTLAEMLVAQRQAAAVRTAEHNRLIADLRRSRRLTTRTHPRLSRGRTWLRATLAPLLPARPRTAPADLQLCCA